MLKRDFTVSAFLKFLITIIFLPHSTATTFCAGSAATVKTAYVYGTQDCKILTIRQIVHESFLLFYIFKYTSFTAMFIAYRMGRNETYLCKQCNCKYFRIFVYVCFRLYPLNDWNRVISLYCQKYFRSQIKLKLKLQS